jgi:hypothetical protein
MAVGCCGRMSGGISGVVVSAGRQWRGGDLGTTPANART